MALYVAAAAVVDREQHMPLLGAAAAAGRDPRQAADIQLLLLRMAAADSAALHQWAGRLQDQVAPCLPAAAAAADTGLHTGCCCWHTAQLVLLLGTGTAAQ
jgi:hypothetical protein